MGPAVPAVRAGLAVGLGLLRFSGLFCLARLTGLIGFTGFAGLAEPA